MDDIVQRTRKHNVQETEGQRRQKPGDLPSEEEAAIVKELDKTLLYYEFLELMGQPVGDLPRQALLSQPYFGERDWREVEKEYLTLYGDLRNSLGAL